MKSANTSNHAAANAAPIHCASASLSDKHYENAVEHCEDLLAELFTSSCGAIIHTGRHVYTALDNAGVLLDSYQAEVDGGSYRVRVTASAELDELLKATGWQGDFDVYINDNTSAPPVAEITSWRCDGAVLHKLSSQPETVRRSSIRQLLQQLQEQLGK